MNKINISSDQKSELDKCNHKACTSSSTCLLKNNPSFRSGYALNVATNRYVKIGGYAYMRAYKAGTLQQPDSGEELPLFTNDYITELSQRKLLRRMVKNKVREILQKERKYKVIENADESESDNSDEVSD